MIFQVALLFFVGMINVQCLPKHKYTANFDLHIAEKGALFDQNIETDIINDIIYYYTPAHNDLNEMYKIQDFKKGLEVSCYPSKAECYKSYLDRSVYPDAARTTGNLVKGYKRNGNQLTSSKQTSVYNKNWYKKGLIEDLSVLGSEQAKEFVKGFGFKLYEVELIPDNAEYLDTTNTTHRQKRQWVPMDCANNAEPVTKYAYTDTNGCDWLYVCDAEIIGQEAHLDCPQSHVRDRHYWSCMCCPEGIRVKDCLCTQLSVAG